MGQVEVEVKVRVEDLGGLERRIRRAGARLIKDLRQVDVYYMHPCRDFSATDEALRVRLEEGRASLTYKGPRIGSIGKSRVEIDVSVEDGGRVMEILEALSFREVARVVKRRRVYLLHNRYLLMLDEVEGLGSFVEVEVRGRWDRLEDAERELLDLLGRLGLKEAKPIRESYLELLLSRKGLI